MYYLTFSLPRVVDQLVEEGFMVTVDHELFTGRDRDLALVIATKP